VRCAFFNNFACLFFFIDLFFFADADGIFSLSFRLPSALAFVSFPEASAEEAQMLVVLADDDEATGEGKYGDVRRRDCPGDKLILTNLLVVPLVSRNNGALNRPTIISATASSAQRK
jgi:hypothetical protein